PLRLRCLEQVDPPVLARLPFGTADVETPDVVRPHERRTLHRLRAEAPLVEHHDRLEMLAVLGARDDRRRPSVLEQPQAIGAGEAAARGQVRGGRARRVPDAGAGRRTGTDTFGGARKGNRAPACPPRRSLTSMASTGPAGGSSKYCGYLSRSRVSARSCSGP